MRIAYLVSEYPAPSHTFIRREIAGLRERGLAIKTYSIRRPGDDVIHSDRDKLNRSETVYILPVRLGAFIKSHLRALTTHPLRYLKVLRLALQHRVAGLKSLLWSLFHFGEAIQLAASLTAEKIDFLHSHFANSGATVGLLAARFAGIPWSLTLHGISETDYPAGVLLRDKIKAATFVSCASYFIRAQAMRLVAPEHWYKLTVIRCTVDLREIPDKPPQKDRQLPLTVVAVGRVSPEKGFHGLLRAFSKVRDKGVYPRLVIVGGGPGLQELHQAAKALDLADQVTLLGAMSESDALVEIANADILALSSLMEGLPVVLIEALALGTPAVATHIAGIPELIVEGETGLLFRPTDWNDLADKLFRLLTDPELRKRLAVAGRKKIEAEYTIQKAAEAMHANFTGSVRRLNHDR